MAAPAVRPGATGNSLPLETTLGAPSPLGTVPAERFRCPGGVASLCPSTTATGGSALGNTYEHDARHRARGRRPATGATGAVGREPVLYVADDPWCRDLLVAFVGHLPGFELRTASDPVAALAAVRHERPSVVLVDGRLGGRPAEGFVQHLAALDPTLPVVILSADAHETTARRYLALGAVAYLPKPFDLAHLSGVLRSLARREVVNPLAPSGRHEEGSSTSAHTTAASWN